MNIEARDAIEQFWHLTVKTRALCPYVGDSAVGKKGYLSPPWYQERGAAYFVNLATPLTSDDTRELNYIGLHINRSFIVAMAAILESHGVVPSGQDPDRSRPGGDYVQLTKWLRNRFAHGDWVFDPGVANHVETRELLEKLFPGAAGEHPGFEIPIDGVLEPLKDEVLNYIGNAQ